MNTKLVYVVCYLSSHIPVLEGVYKVEAEAEKAVERLSKVQTAWYEEVNFYE